VSVRRKDGRRTRIGLCAIDEAVLNAQAAGASWKTVPGMRSEARFKRTLARAQWRRSRRRLE
jgi:hypothetical protein